MINDWQKDTRICCSHHHGYYQSTRGRHNSRQKTMPSKINKQWWVWEFAKLKFNVTTNGDNYDIMTVWNGKHKLQQRRQQLQQQRSPHIESSFRQLTSNAILGCKFYQKLQWYVMKIPLRLRICHLLCWYDARSHSHLSPVVDSASKKERSQASTISRVL